MWSLFVRSMLNRERLVASIWPACMQLELDADQLPAALSLLEEAGDIATVLR